MKRFSLSLTSLAAAIAWFGFVTGPFADSAEAAVITTGSASYSSSSAGWFIGLHSPGSLTIDNGSQETTGILGSIGIHNPGTVTVNGRGSFWQFKRAGMDGWEGSLKVGNNYSSGTLNIENGGRVNIEKHAVIGNRGGSQGTATVACLVMWGWVPMVPSQAAVQDLRSMAMYPAQDRSVTPRFMATSTWATVSGS